ncbi:MAG: RNA 3'-terminal phosphate cyclase [Candidatus Zipacnadales bacterium]
MLTIDGSYGEGGGQVLRTALSLAAVTGTDLRIFNIRAGRKKPGLAAQHLTCVRAAAEVCGAEVTGDGLGSQELTFRPGVPQPGNYIFDVADVRPSAGSVNLVLQTILPILACCKAPSRVTLRGGTHVPWSPTFDYVQEVFLPAVRELGVQATIELKAAGFYPRGGGEEILYVRPTADWVGADFTQPRAPLRCRVLSRICCLARQVGERQMQPIRQWLAQRPYEAEYVIEELPGIAPGTVAVAATRPGCGGWGGNTALGAPGKRAEKVGEEAIDAFRRFLDCGATIDRHLTDQLLLYAALAEGSTTLAVEAITEHTRTNVWVIDRFLPGCFVIDESSEGPARLHIQGAGKPH